MAGRGRLWLPVLPVPVCAGDLMQPTEWALLAIEPEMAALRLSSADSPPGAASRDGDDSDKGTGALARLARLPVELQDAVIRYLPLADVLVWYRVDRDFQHRITVARLRERAAGRALGADFARRAFSRENHDRLLRPWLAGFAANRLGPGWPGAALCPETLCGTVIRTLKQTRCLTLAEQASFELPGGAISEPAFSPTGRYMTVSTQVRSRAGSLRPLAHIFSWSPAGWQEGSPFVSTPGAGSLCFSADEQQVAVAWEEEVVIWHNTQDHWHQTACLAPPDKALSLCGLRLNMRFSPDGRCLLIQTRYGHQSVWERDDGSHWRLGAHFFVGNAHADYAPTLFSPDSRWLLVRSGARQFVPCSRAANGAWVCHSPLVPQGQSVANQALFRPCRSQVFLLLADARLSLWQCHGGRWCEQGTVEHPAGIYAARFSPDGQSLVTESGQSGSLLWTEGLEGKWTAQHSLYRPDPRCGLIPFVHFDPGGQWLIAGNFVRRAGDRRGLGFWAKDRGGQWRCCPEGADALLDASCLELVPCRDGQHLAVLGHRDEPGSWQGLRLLACQGGRWVVKAARVPPRHFYRDVAMDPFCCHLAVTRSFDGAARVDFLRVEEADTRGTGQDS